MQVTGLTVYISLGHAFTSHHFPAERLRNLVLRRDLNQVSVKVLDSFAEAEEGLLKGDREIDEQVVVDALELLVRLLLNCEYKVPGDHVGDLLGFTLKHHLVTILHSFLNLHI